MDEYDEIEIDPIEILFDKLYKARKGEMILIHVTEFSKDGRPAVKMCSVINKKGSIMSKILPSLVEDLIG